MDFVDLLRCSRCKLTFVRGSEMFPGTCPACRRAFADPSQIIVAGLNVPVRSVLVYGEGLMSLEVRRGLDKLQVGDMCPHGWITKIICPMCNTV